MKKMLVTLGIAGLMLVGCSSGNKDNKKDTTTTETAQKTEHKSMVAYKDNSITTPEGTITFEKSEIHTNDLSGEHLIVLIFDYTNTTDKEVQAASVLGNYTKVKQILDATTVELDGNMLQDSDSSIQMAKDATNQTNPGATIKGAYAYTIENDNKPVTIDILDENGNVIGSREIDISK